MPISIAIFVFIFTSIINTRKIFNQVDITSITPEFENVETQITNNSTFVKFQFLTNYNHDYKYQLYISKNNLDTWENNVKFFQNWKYSNDDFVSFYEDEKLWMKWDIYPYCNDRIFKVENLQSNSLYRLKYVIVSKHGESKFSKLKYINTERQNIEDNFINLYVKGTGRNNHDNSVVKLNNNTILNHGLYQGLALIILNRINLKVLQIEFFDTFNNIVNTTSLPVILPFKYFSYTSDGSILRNTTDRYLNKTKSESERLFDVLSSLNENRIFILVSCYGWEKYFTPELADLLARFGGLNILEFKQKSYDELESVSLINKHNFHHPFAFIGIPFIGPAGGYESIRTNKGHYLSIKDLPFAELLVKLKYNEFGRNYYFDEKQYNHKFNYADYYEYLFEAKDYSLKNLFSFLIYANTTTEFNDGFSIYQPNRDIERLAVRRGGFRSELDRVVIGDFKFPNRIFRNKTIFQEGVIIDQLSYYNFYISAGIKTKDCLPPYTSIPECPQVITNDIPILSCKIGLAPQVCLENLGFRYSFPGFN